VAEVVAVGAHRIDRLLQRRGVTAPSEESGGADRWAEEAPALAGLAAASVQGVLTCRRRIARCTGPPEEVTAVTLAQCHANVDGFDLHAGIVIPVGQRERLERLCCYTLRRPIAQTRLHIDAEGQVWITLRHQWSDGTMHLRFDPVALLERLAMLVPRPRINMVPYYGLLAPRAPLRAAVVASAGSEWSDAAAAMGPVADEGNDSAGRRRPWGYLWAELMLRDVWDRRARLPALWRPAAVARADRARARRGTHPPALGPPHRPAGAATRSGPAAARR
jgi:hypothetical protein